MVKHVILWTLKDEFSDGEKEAIKKGIKENLEGLKGVIPGLIDIRVITNGLSSSTADLTLDSSFESVQALKDYSKNPKHQEVANTYVRPNVKIRSCFDYEID